MHQCYVVSLRRASQGQKVVYNPEICLEKNHNLCMSATRGVDLTEIFFASESNVYTLDARNK